MWAGFGMKPGFHIERPMTNCLSHGKTHVDVMVSNINVDSKNYTIREHSRDVSIGMKTKHFWCVSLRQTIDIVNVVLKVFGYGNLVVLVKLKSWTK